jgi:hypothetical protein
MSDYFPCTRSQNNKILKLMTTDVIREEWNLDIYSNDKTHLFVLMTGHNTIMLIKSKT